MSRKLGPLTWGKRQELQFLQGQGVTEERNYSEQTAEAIDAEVRALVEEGHRRATEIITRRRAVLDALSEYLLEKEVISGEEVDEVIERVEGKGAADRKGTKASHGSGCARGAVAPGIRARRRSR